MKFWGVSQKELGSSAHKFHGVLGSRGGVAKMFENIFFWKIWVQRAKK